MANKYVLQGNGIQVDYTIGGNPGFTALDLHRRHDPQVVHPGADHHRSDRAWNAGLGGAGDSIDNGGTRFGFFLPDVQVSLGQGVPVTTSA